MDLGINYPLDDEYERESFENLLATEEEFMVAENYHQNANMAVQRHTALLFILKLYRETPFNPDDPVIPFLALISFDRYASRQPLQDQPTLKLIAFCCFTLAWKSRTCRFIMRQVLDGYNFVNYQVVEVKRMEFKILSALKWRMQSITAFCFFDFFISLSNIDNPQTIKNLKTGAAPNVNKTYGDIQFTQFKPSIIAASALIAESMSSGHTHMRAALAPFVDGEELNRCIDKMSTLVINNVLASIQATHGSSASTSTDQDE